MSSPVCSELPPQRTSLAGELWGDVVSAMFQSSCLQPGGMAGCKHVGGRRGALAVASLRQRLCAKLLGFRPRIHHTRLPPLSSALPSAAKLFPAVRCCLRPSSIRSRRQGSTERRRRRDFDCGLWSSHRRVCAGSPSPAGRARVSPRPWWAQRCPSARKPRQVCSHYTLSLQTHLMCSFITMGTMAGGSGHRFSFLRRLPSSKKNFPFQVLVHVLRVDSEP